MVSRQLQLKQSASDPEHNRELRRIVSRGTEPLSPRAAAEPKRHSQPGTSGIIPILNKSSHKLLKSRSNIFKRNTPSTSHIPVTKSKGILSTGDLSKKSSQNLSRARHKSEERIDDSPKKLKSISKLFGRSKTDLKSRDSKEEFREEKKRVTLSQPNLRIGSDDSFMPSSDSKALLLGKMKPCECPPSSQGTVSEFFGRWDSLLVVLVCVMVILLSMTAPLSLYFSRRRSS
ncbi:uncharacterized protein LOC135075475 [Ostrinia nubilalis]|uniref:uncharacterized protein LOC135075475 n=1 Tax=Ostrinia nubilalis TaxID=29057 RepID=UPI0030824E9B